MSTGTVVQDRVILIEGIPSSNPPDGHKFLYIDPNDGYVKTRGSNGNINRYGIVEEDTYEVHFRDGAGGTSLGSHTARYRKVGKTVILFIKLQNGLSTGGSNDLTMSIPFTPSSNWVNSANIISNNTSSGGAKQAFILDGNDYVLFSKTIGSVAGADRVQASEVDSNTRLYFTLTYSI